MAVALVSRVKRASSSGWSSKPRQPSTG